MFAQDILSERIKVLVYSECVLFVDGLRQIYNGKSSFSIVRTLNAHQNLAESAKIIRPEIILFEVSKFTNLIVNQIQQLQQSEYAGKLLLLLNPSDMGTNLQVILSSGVDGYVPRDSSHEDMTNALTVVSSGGLYFPQLSSKNVVAQPQGPVFEKSSNVRPLKTLETDVKSDKNLSDREKVVLRKMAMGLCMKQIASDINLSSKTVDTYRSRAMKKLNLLDRHAVVKYAIRSGWMDEL